MNEDYVYVVEWEERIKPLCFCCQQNTTHHVWKKHSSEFLANAKAATEVENDLWMAHDEGRKDIKNTIIKRAKISDFNEV